ncbi:hypothetical protein [Rhizobium oryzicola]|uniref:Transmembrane protein n=1 Tax=Rhizobium oryzicola TaxID=1232668 RepID=A0ABT8T1H0_9HYPH|nr:hypothetical protein [Rhizobium oryzicola]MDO1584595.1 hypothetical protein [Rhizobium oryzicola]
MKRYLAASLGLLLLCGCTTAELTPVPGSITYGGQPRSHLTKAPVGSIVNNEFNDGRRMVYETYVIQPDRSLKLIDRRYRPDLAAFD